MTERTTQGLQVLPPSNRSVGVDEHWAARRALTLKKRYAAESRFRWYGRLSVTFGLCCVLIMFTDIVNKGMGAFTQTYIDIEFFFDQQVLGLSPNSSKEEIELASFSSFFKSSLRANYPEVITLEQKRELHSLFTSDAPLILRDFILADPSVIGTSQTISIIASGDTDLYYKHLGGQRIDRLSDFQKTLISQLVDQGLIKHRFNTSFFSNPDSREPELAGIRGAITGSFFTLLVTLTLSFPIAVATAIYLEEFASANRLTDFIEVNINNLAAVPSIIFGLLGLAIFINFFGLPRSVPLVGGIVLTLMTLPTIIISSRAAIKAVPDSVRQAAMGMGASPVQTVLHHVIPAAMHGMLTGTIIAMAQALGETAPLLMIGMVVFIVDVPTGIIDPATVLPVQIFLWSDSPEPAFVEKTAAAIMVLLAILICMNGVAAGLRRRLERRW